MSFAGIFFPVFLVLFVIASVILFIKISSLTSVVQINLWDITMLYLYTLPSMIFFVIPISFFGAGLSALSKLSFEYELNILFSLGLNPLKIIKVFLPSALLVSLVLLVVSLMLVPLSNTAYRSFLETKKIDANINLKAGQFGQKFGDWLIFVEQEDKETSQYKNVILLHFGNKQNSLLLADSVLLNNHGGVLEANLTNGSLYRSKGLQQIEKVVFDDLILRNVLGSSNEVVDGVVEYWKQAFGEEYSQKVRRNFNMSILVSLFPLVCLFYWLWFGINNPRFNKNHSLFFIVAVAGIFYGTVYLSGQFFPLAGLFIIPCIWLVSGYLGFRYFKGTY